MAQLLYEAIRGNKTQSALNLLKDLKVHERINDLFKDGFTCLYLACQEQNVPVVEKILTIPTVDVDTVGWKGFTALHVAAYFGNVKLVILLCDRGAAITVDEEGCTPKDYANRKCHFRVVECLNYYDAYTQLEPKSKVSFKETYTWMFSSDKTSLTNDESEAKEAGSETMWELSAVSPQGLVSTVSGNIVNQLNTGPVSHIAQDCSGLYITSEKDYYRALQHTEMSQSTHELEEPIQLSDASEETEDLVIIQPRAASEITSEARQSINQLRSRVTELEEKYENVTREKLFLEEKVKQFENESAQHKETANNNQREILSLSEMNAQLEKQLDQQDINPKLSRDIPQHEQGTKMEKILSILESRTSEINGLKFKFDEQNSHLLTILALLTDKCNGSKQSADDSSALQQTLATVHHLRDHFWELWDRVDRVGIKLRGLKEFGNTSHLAHTDKDQDRDIKDVIKVNFEKLKSNIDPADHIDYLYSEHALTDEDRERICHEPGPKTQTKLLLKTLLGKCDCKKWVPIFIQSLRREKSTRHLLELFGLRNIAK